jgi:hypothetical protein
MAVRRREPIEPMTLGNMRERDVVAVPAYGRPMAYAGRDGDGKRGRGASAQGKSTISRSGDRPL